MFTRSRLSAICLPIIVLMLLVVVSVGVADSAPLLANPLDVIGVASPSALSFTAAVTGTVSAAVCADHSAFVADVSVPDGTAFAPGAPITKTWRLKNTGTCAWDAAYAFRFVSGDKLGATDAQPIAGTSVAATVDITVPMTAPTAAGNYTGIWQMANPHGATFGTKVSINIRVGSGASITGTAVVTGTTPPTPGKAVTGTTTTAGAPALVQLAGHLAWEVFKPGVNKPTYDIYVSKLDGSEKRLLWEWGRQPRIRAYDSRVVLNGDGNAKDSLWGVNLDGSNPQEMSPTADDSHPFWSPQGDRLLFDAETRVDQGGKTGKMWTVWTQDGLTRNAKRNGLPVANRGAAGRSPIWLKNDWVVYTGCNYWASGGSCGLYAVPSWGADQARQLTTNPNDSATDSFDERILYSCNPDGNWDVCALNFDGSQQVNLTKSPTNDGTPAFSQDGKSIAFLSDRSGVWAVWVMNADGSNPVKAFDLPGSMGDDWVGERISWGP